MLTLEFWKGALIRAIRTFAQAFGSAGLGDGLGVWNVDWKTSLGLGLGAALGSLLMSIDRAPKDPSENDVRVIKSAPITINPVDVAPAEAP